MAESTVKRTRKTAAPKEETAVETPAVEAVKEKTYTESVMNEIVRQAIETALANLKPANTVSADEMVTVIYLDEVAAESILEIEGYGVMRPGESLDVPKKEFGNKFMSNKVRKLLERRKLIVTNGLDADERHRWNVDYESGSVMDRQVFDKMLDYDVDKICGIFRLLCKEHQTTVAQRFATAYFPENGGMPDNRISIEKVKALNNISKATDPNGMFTAILKKMSADIME